MPSNVIARKVARSQRFLVATPDYLKRHGHLRRPEDLIKHNYIRFAWASTGDTVELHSNNRSVSVKTKSRYRVNNAMSIRESLAMGSGIGLCPSWLVHDLLESRLLTHVLPDWSATHQELVMLYPSRRYQPLRAKLFIEFICEQVIALPGFANPA